MGRVDSRRDAENAEDAESLSEPGERLNRLTGKVIGAAIEVHRHLGPGFRESAYEQALCIELTERAVPFERQVAVPLEYKGRPVGECVLDLLVAKRLVVELKSVESLGPIHVAQVASYLRATRQHVGLLLNFNVPALRQGIRRVILTS
jgi:GxxExxY protein